MNSALRSTNTTFTEGLPKINENSALWNSYSNIGLVLRDELLIDTLIFKLKADEIKK